MECRVTGTLLLDTHAVHWWTAEPERVSDPAATAIEQAAEIAVAAITWYELGWLAHHGRISVAIPVRTWLAELSKDVRTLPLTAIIAETAVALPETFPGDPADRMIFATAVEHGIRLVSKDRRLRAHRHPRPLVVW